MENQSQSPEQLRRQVAALEQQIAAGRAEVEQLRSALRESQRKLAALTSNLPVAAYRCQNDSHWTVEFISEGCFPLTGYHPADFVENRTVSPRDIIHPDDLQAVRQAIQEAVAAKQRFQMVYRIRTAAGEEKWVWDQAIGVFSESGRLETLEGFIMDITERKRAQEELARSRATLQAAIESLPFDFWAIAPDGRYMLANAACKANWGDLVGKRPEEVAGSKDTLAIWLENNRCAFAGEKVEGEVVFTVKGERRIYHNVITPIREGQQVLGILGVNVDITKRKEMELALMQAHHELEGKVQERTAQLAEANEQLKREVEQRRRAEEELVLFRQFAETSGQGFGMAELDGRITYANPTLCRLYGEEKPADVLGKNLTTYYPEEHKQRQQQEVLPTLLREGYWQGELTIVSRQGKLIPAQHHSFLIRDEQGNPLRRATVITDVTAQKEAEEALRQSEEKYKTLVETSPDGVIMADLQGRPTFASPRILELYGSERPEDLLGHDPLEFIAPEDYKKFFADLRGALEEGIARDIEYTFVRKDGTRFPGELSTAVIRDALGRPQALMALIRDVTRRKQAEEALRKEQQVLKHLLQASDHERQLIAYDIHDGLAQQLAAAIMQFQIFEYLADKTTAEAARVYEAAVAMLRQAHFEARRLISGVRPPILDESGIVAALAHLVHDQTLERGPKVEFHSKVSFQRLEAVLENALYRIVQEGLTNACKHSQSQKVRVALQQRGDQVRVEISDWGVGFEPSKVKEGCYGLEGIRQRARLLGGRATIKSTPGKGTRISVRLPLVPREAAP
jgi:PAS domain S-box-containing protein